MLDICPDVERVARAICKADGVDPEMICVGLGRTIPEGIKVPAWQVRIPQAIAAIEAWLMVEED